MVFVVGNGVLEDLGLSAWSHNAHRSEVAYRRKASVVNLLPTGPNVSHVAGRNGHHPAKAHRPRSRAKL